MKCPSKCCHKIFGMAFLVFAIIIAIIACSHFGDQHQSGLLTVAKFFDVVIPILGTGALIKYLFSGRCNCKCCNPEGKETSCSTHTS